MKKALSLILVLVMAAALLVCPAMAAGGNGGGGGGGNGGGNGQSPLSVVSVTVIGKDLEGRAVKPNTRITVTFDRGMDKHSEENAAMMFVEGLECVVGFDGNRTYTIDFSDAPVGRYTFIVKAGVMANNGNTLGEDYKVTFFVSDGSGEYYGEPCPSVDFTDVDRSQNSWYHKAVDWAVSNDITKGTSETTFSPDKACSRAEAVTFLYRAAGEPSVEGLENPFTDVKAGSFYYDAVLWAVSKGITNGMTKTTFEPDTTCTRAHIVTFLWRACGEPEVADAELTYVDVPAGEWYTVPVIWADGERITNGVDETHFAPMSDCTRAHIVTFLYRAA